jgi:uncharacterized protein (DUF433 family)
METVIAINPNIMHDAPCFAGTRVTVQILFDHLEAGYSLDEFHAQFPTVRRESVKELLAQLKQKAAQLAVPTPA